MQRRGKDQREEGQKGDDLVGAATGTQQGGHNHQRQGEETERHGRFRRRW